jgi:hypothetical protein
MGRRHLEAAGLLTTIAMIASWGCDSPSPTASGAEPAPGILADQKTSNPPFDATNFVAGIDNPYLPLTP